MTKPLHYDRHANDDLADLLIDVAELFEEQRAAPSIVDRYRSAAAALRRSAVSVAGVLSRPDGRRALAEQLGVDGMVVSALDEYTHTGRLGLLDRLEGDVDPVALFGSVPGMGRELAKRAYEALRVDTLEELEAAAYDGRLAQVRGFGRRRLALLRDQLDRQLCHSSRRASRIPAVLGAEAVATPHAAIDVLLDADAEYRTRAEAGELPMIAPRRFNPARERWLPILHTARGGWQMMLMFANTTVAHRADHVRDWVVVVCANDGHERQYTIVTGQAPPYAGRRIVRGREQECHDYYERAARAPEVMVR